MNDNTILYTDTHSHLYDESFNGESPNVIERAIEAGVTKLFLPAVDSESHQKLIEIANAYPDNCFPMIGLHPTSVNDNPDYKKELDIVEAYLKTPPVKMFYGSGEIGLDLHWSQDWLKEQKDALHIQIELAITYDLPIILHTRTAWKEMVELLEEYKHRGIRGIIHAYSGNADHYRKIKEFGDFVFGIGGVITYKKSFIAEVIHQMDLNDLVLETDTPYLTPVPFRGKRNESSYIPYICNTIAELKGTTRREVARVTNENSARIFGI